MKIIHVCQFLGVGGLEKVLLSLTLEQKRKGHDVSVIVYDHDKRWVRKFTEAGIPVNDRYNKKPGYDFGLLKHLKRALSDAQIVHTHDLNPMLYAGPLRLAKALPKGCKLVHTTHGMEHLETTPKTRFYELFLGVAAEKIICVSETFKNHYLGQPGVNEDKVVLIQNGTEIPELTASEKAVAKESLLQEFDLLPNEPIACYVGRVCPMKGQLELIKEFERQKRQLLIIGPPSDESYFSECASACEKYVKMTGSREDVSRILDGCDYFVSNSLHEGMPIAAMEAGARGLPCYLSDIPGHRLFNETSDCVGLFKDFAQLDELIQNRSRWELPFSQNMRSLIEKNYSSSAMELKYFNVYRDLACSQS